MKTTIDIAAALLIEAKRKARDENRTLRELVEEGLRLVLKEKDGTPFRLKKHPFEGGKGLQSGMEEGNWSQLRDMIYGFEPESKAR